MEDASDKRLLFNVFLSFFEIKRHDGVVFACKRELGFMFIWE